MAQILELQQAIRAHVHDGDVVALEGFTHLIPYAAGHEIIRQGRRDLTLVRMTPDVIYDQLIGAGCVRKLIFSWGGNPGVGSLHRFRDAVEKAWPQALELEERSHSDLANAFAAGASGLPFAVLRGYAGSDLPSVNPQLKTIQCPFTGEQLAATPSVRPDVTVIHAQKADRRGNVPYGSPKVRLPGAGGAPEISASAKEVLIILKQSARTFVEKLDFVTSVGHYRGGDSRKQLNLPGSGPSAVITDLCIMRPDAVSRELTVTQLHPGITAEQVRKATGWPILFAESVDETLPPSLVELDILRALEARTALAHGGAEAEA